MRIVADMSSVLWTSLLRGNDPEATEVDHFGRKVKVNSVSHGYENVVDLLEVVLEKFDCAPKDLIMVFEGRDSKRKRCLIDSRYKSNREGEADSRPELAYEHFRDLRELVRQTYKDLGSIAVTQDYVEGDDIIAFIAANTEEDIVILSNDNDLLALIGVNGYGAKVSLYANGEVDHNKFGEFDPALLTLYKALVGDSSDNVKGVKGFGPKAWMTLNVRYGDDGCTELMALLEQGRRDEVAEIAEDNNCSLLRKIAENWEDALKSYRLVKLYPEWVDTNRQPLQWDAGMVKDATTDERLVKWKAASVLVTASNFDKALERLKARLPETEAVGFDIETSTGEESDDWLAAQGNPKGVDVIGSELTGFTINFGKNNQYSYYVTVDHLETEKHKNVSMKQARQMIEACFGKKILVANANFELSVLFANCKDEDGWWRDLWKDAGEFGMLPGIRDVQLEASYVDENRPLGLKFRSKYHLDYDQASYDDTTLLDERKFSGGQEEKGKWRYKMKELPAAHVAAYGNDDGVVTSALHNLYKFRMQLEHHYEVYKKVELDAAYLHAKAFVDGVSVDMAKLQELEAEDKEVYRVNWGILRDYLLKNGWDGTVPPVYEGELTAKQVKEAYAIVMGLDNDEPDEDDEEATPVADPVLKSRIRTVSKLAALIAEQGQEELAHLIQSGDLHSLTKYVQARFDGEPRFKMSNKQMTRLMYEVMKLPVRVRGKITPTMRAKGIQEGNPKADDLAIQHALQDADEDCRKVLEAIKLIRMVQTRESLYYKTYPYMIHWKTGKIHSSHRQCSTNTRRASSSNPNLQQLSKHEKIQGYASRFREVLIPDNSEAVVVSMDFSGQELRVIAEYSQDENMLACFVGENKKDMHALTAAGIFKKKEPEAYKFVSNQLGNTDDIDYKAFTWLQEGDEHHVKLYKQYRALGKTTNFAGSYGAMAGKLSQTLMVSEADAEIYLEAKEKAFQGEAKWKEQVQKEAAKIGYVTTMLGARRHLAEAFNSPDRFVSSKAERQAVNFKVQGSSAEMTKLAEGRMWRMGLFAGEHNTFIHPIHDECVAICRKQDLHEFIQKMHSCMVAPYADMKVPIESSISFGPNFGQQIEIGTEPSVEAIDEGLSKL